MLRSAIGSAVFMLLGVSLALGQAQTSHKHPKAAQQPAAVEDTVPPDPVVMQKWFGQAVDNILTDANRAVTGQPEKGR